MWQCTCTIVLKFSKDPWQILDSSLEELFEVTKFLCWVLKTFFTLSVPQLSLHYVIMKNLGRIVVLSQCPRDKKLHILVGRCLLL